MVCREVATIQQKSRSPRLARHFHPPITKGKRIAVNRLSPNAKRKRTASSGIFACFQRAIGPTPIRNAAGAIKGTKTLLKYGVPPENLPGFNGSTKSGHNLQRRADPARTSTKTVFGSTNDSREGSSNFEPRR